MTGWSELLEGRRSNGSSRDALTISVDFVTMRSNPSYPFGLHENGSV